MPRGSLKALRGLVLCAVFPALAAQTVSTSDLIAQARQRIESTDVRASGHLQWAPPTGPRISYPISVKAHSFAGVLRMRADIGQPSSIKNDVREHLLIEMRPNGDHVIRVAVPGDKAARVLAFDKWSAHPLTPGFSYEDLLEQQYLWAGQTSEGNATFGARKCQVVKSTPAAGDKTHYASVKTWFDPVIGFPVYVEKTEKETGAVKQVTYFGIQKEAGMWAARQIEIQIKGQPGSTFLIFDRGTPKAKLTLQDFDAASLTQF